MADQPKPPSDRPPASPLLRHSEALDELIREVLVERTLGLEDSELAAYLSGWGSLLDLLRRTDLIFPGLESPAKAALAELVERLRVAQFHALEEADFADSPSPTPIVRQ